MQTSVATFTNILKNRLICNLPSVVITIKIEQHLDFICLLLFAKEVCVNCSCQYCSASNLEDENVWDVSTNNQMAYFPFPRVPLLRIEKIVLTKSLFLTIN